MAAGRPLSDLTLSAASVADDLGFVALADLSGVIEDGTADCRLIGGHRISDSPAYAP